MSTTVEPIGSSTAPHRFVIVGGTIHDPLHGRDGAVGVDPCERPRVGRRGDDPAVLHPDVGHAAVPTIHSTGALYAALGYTTVFDAAIATAAAGLAHLELAELPILDNGVYLLAADDAHVVTALDRDRDGQGDREVQRLVAQAVQAGRGWA
ncbi:MAG: hypothetical protein ACKOK8_04075, partial [Planctomycetia bacterium]